VKLSDLDREVRAIADEIARIDKDSPELTGFELAWERGNISQEEWESVQANAQANTKLQQEQIVRIEKLRDQQPVLMATFVTDLVARLAALKDAVDAKLANVPVAEQDRTLSFNRILLPDVCACLTSWRDGTEPKHWIAWAWRLAFRMADETEAALKR